MKSNNLIEDLLNLISPEESLRIENKMLMATKIGEALKAKGWKKKDLIKALGKTNQSEVTKWLSGTHNFTIDLLTDLSRVLNVNLFNIEKHETVVEKIFKTQTVIVTVHAGASEKKCYNSDLIAANTIANIQSPSIDFYSQKSN